MGFVVVVFSFSMSASSKIRVLLEEQLDYHLPSRLWSLVGTLCMLIGLQPWELPR